MPLTRVQLTRTLSAPALLTLRLDGAGGLHLMTADTTDVHAPQDALYLTPSPSALIFSL